MNKPIKRVQSELVHFAEREVSRTEFNKPIKRVQSELVHFAKREVSRTEFNKPIKRVQKELAYDSYIRSDISAKGLVTSPI